MEQQRSEAALVRRAQQGDSVAFASLFDGSRDELSKYVTSRIGDHLRPRVDPDDVLQETWVRAWDSIERLEWTGAGTFVRWLKGISRHVILQQAARQRQDPLIYLAEREASADPSPSRAARREERFDRLRQAVDRLPADYREAVILVRLDGLSIREAAARMNRTPKSVTHLLSRALKKLKEDLGDTETLGLPPRRLRRGDRDHD